MPHPMIIQGGMGVAVSNWRLAGAVAQAGQLGVVSGTLLSGVLIRRLQNGDRDGTVRRALREFPIPRLADRILADYFIPGGKARNARFKLAPMPTLTPSRASTELIVAANFVEVFLAKEGHSGLVGINLLEKIQLVTLPSLYGAMLAGVDYVLMGAGIPRTIPGALDRLAAGLSASLKIDAQGEDAGDRCASVFDPRDLFDGLIPVLKRPRFIAIVSSATLATTLVKKSTGQIDGFVVEMDVAGGHNAPPRGTMELNAAGEPVYGPRDVPDLQKISALKLPFWLAGSYGQPGKLSDAIRLGAHGIQVGTAFAFCQESGIDDTIKERVLAAIVDGTVRVFTDPVASPTGFPFKVLRVNGTLSDSSVYADRKRICDLGYLRQPYKSSDGKIGYRCPAEPVDDYVLKGGNAADTIGRKCLCNGLMATAGYPQARGDGEFEPAVVTAGTDIANLAHFLGHGAKSYSARNVIFRLFEEMD